MTYDYGGRIHTVVLRKSHNLVPLLGGAVLFCASILYYANFDYILDYFIAFAATIFSVIYFIIFLRMPDEKEMFVVYENGVKSPSLKWTGDCFLPFSEIRSAQYDELTYKGNKKTYYIIFSPYDLSKYIQRQGYVQRHKNFSKNTRFKSPLFVLLTHDFLITPDKKASEEIYIICQNALEKFQAARN